MDNPSKRVPAKMLATALAILLAAMSLQFCSGQAQENNQALARPVKTATIEQGTSNQGIRTSGLVSAKSEAKLAYKIAGYIGKILVEEGDFVRRGQKLAALKADEINARVTQARSVRDKAQRDLERVQHLYADSVVTLENLQDATSALQIAGADLEIAEFNQRHAQITAPADGRILRRFGETGELIAAGSPAFVFRANNQDWVVRCGVGEQELLKVKPGDAAMVHFDGWPGQKFAATVTQVAEALDPRSATFEIELRLSDPPARLASGFLAIANIIPSTNQVYQFIPIDALVQADQNRGFIFLLDSDKNIAIREEINIVDILDDRIAIANAALTAKQVITEGAPYLQHGDAVVLVQE